MKNEQIISALKLIISKYSKSLAIQVEQLTRNETKHYNSAGWVDNFCPGMEAFKEFQPYGWNVVDKFWKENPQYAPVKVVDQIENSSAMSGSRGVRHFLKFQNVESALMTVAFIINSHGGDGGSWFSVTNVTARKKYNDALKLIVPRFVNSIK